MAWFDTRGVAGYVPEEAPPAPKKQDKKGGDKKGGDKKGGDKGHKGDAKHGKGDAKAVVPVKSILADPNASLEAPYSQHYCGRTVIKKIVGRPDGGAGLAGQKITIGGWVKTGREQGKGEFAFLEINDGSCPTNLQVMVNKDVHDLTKLIPTGTCVVVEGELTKPPEGVKQKVELKALTIKDLGTCDPATYPIAKGRLGLDYLRTVMHLRNRTNTISAVARVRNALAYATHKFFQERQFLYVHAPLITTSDCEGAGEMFQVTTLLSNLEEAAKIKPPSAAEIAAMQKAVDVQGAKVKEAKDAKTKGSKVDVKKEVDKLLAAKTDLEVGEANVRKASGGGLPRLPDGSIDYGQDFFAKAAFLTVSGQLQGEIYACGLGQIYTFGPTFRAENSNTARHLAEFWMIEPELAFADLDDDMQCAEDYVRYCCQHLLENHLDDLEFFKKMIDKSCIDRLEQVVTTPFKRVSYTEAVDILMAAIKAGKKKFEYEVEWGVDLASEHERYLTEEVFKQPIIVYNYPKDIKAFYMRLNDDNKTVAAMDLLVPKVGELVGGSQREERADVLERRIKESGMPIEPYEWYLQLRRYGSCTHSGFGLGFERLVLFATGVDNIRDVIPFPRWPLHAEF